ncbi:MAG TPA: radical SAM protein [Acetobacteraceae bacterium]|nr:radical SAM protein [Rhodocyclaceae bacterium]HUZ63879.1 radical SAM protein [Acetobacteraceae bacterium]
MPDGARFDPTVVVTFATDQPVLVFGGCYSNLQATEALLQAAERLRVPPERMICTGDVIAYGADPRATLALIRAAGIAIVMGNCEESLGADAADCGCGFAPGSACDRLSAAWFAHATREVGPADRGWMAALPRRIDLVLGGRRLAVVHGTPSRINRFVFDSTPDAELLDELALVGTDGVIGGHCGLPFTRRIGERLWHNSGAIGLPANDGTPRGWFSLLTPRDQGVEVRHLPLDYDHHGAARAMRAAGLPEGYAQALETGIWPSFDVLPPVEQAATGTALAPAPRVWDRLPPPPPRPQPRAFADRDRTARGEPHARVPLARLSTLWFNTGTLCNIACTGCYIDSNPRNDRLVYLDRAAFDRFLDEAATLHPELREIGFTGGEPFLNPDAPGMIAAALDRGYRVLVLTNAMRPMQRHRAQLERLAAVAGNRLAFRVSLDHFTRDGHDQVRGAGSFAAALAGLVWLAAAGFLLAVAARLPAPAEEARMRTGFARLFREQELPIDAWDPAQLVLFPELADPAVPPEIGATAWAALHAGGREVMCGSARMVVHRKGEAAPRVVACTLQPYEPGFDLGASLAEAARPVVLNHPHCARFCVFGAASCGAGGEQAVSVDAPGGAA